MTPFLKRDIASYIQFPPKLFPSLLIFATRIVQVKSTLLTIRKGLKNLYFLVFINGVLLASLLYFEIEADYDSSIFNALVENVKADKSARLSQDTFLLRSMRMANALQQNRQKIFEGVEINDIKSSLLHNSLDDLLTGRGACGSASAILVRMLQIDGYETRLAQMKVNGTYGGHIIVEAKKGKGWIVMDPLYNCYFKKPGGQFASFEEVQKNWNYYKAFTPAGYPIDYKFEDVRYTNWEKLPVAGPIAKSTLAFFMGKKNADHVSLRPYLLQNFQIIFYILQFIFIPVLLLTIHMFYKRSLSRKLQAKHSYANKTEDAVITYVNVPEYNRA